MSDSTRETIVALHLAGRTNGQIRQSTGLSRGTIGGHLDRWRKEERVKNATHHQYRPYAPSMIDRSEPTFDRDRDAERRHRENDDRFIRELAKAFQRGDHIPNGGAKPLVLIG